MASLKMNCPCVSTWTIPVCHFSVTLFFVFRPRLIHSHSVISSDRDRCYHFHDSEDAKYIFVSLVVRRSTSLFQSEHLLLTYLLHQTLSLHINTRFKVVYPWPLPLLLIYTNTPEISTVLSRRSVVSFRNVVCVKFPWWMFWGVGCAVVVNDPHILWKQALGDPALQGGKRKHTFLWGQFY